MTEAGSRPGARWVVGGIAVLAVALAVGAVASQRSDLGASRPEPTAAPTTASLPSPVPQDPFAYELAVVRDRNVVVVLESTGWTERTERTLEIALQRAIPSERGRCGTDTGPCPVLKAPSGESGQATALVLAADPMLGNDDWATVIGHENFVVRGLAPPTRLMECIAVERVAAAAEVHAATYLEPARPGVTLNEYVLRYADEAAAAEAVATIRSQSHACPDPTLARFTPPDVTSWWQVDEVYIVDLVL